MSIRRLYLGYALSPFGFADSAWHGGSPSELGFNTILRQVRDARAAGFDFVTLLDGYAQRPGVDLQSGNLTFEPTTLIAALSSRARDIGFLAAASVAQHEAYNLARRFASLDTISDGRSGWLVLGSGDSPRDKEYIEVVRGLWNSWDADAFLYDKAAARFFDPSKMHTLNHEGTTLSVRGPLNVNRSPQGEPVLATIFGRSAPDAIWHADIVLLEATSVTHARALRQEVDVLLASAGRSASSVRVLANLILTPIVVDAAHEALPSAVGKVPGLSVVGTGAALAETLVGIADETGLDGYNVVPADLASAERFFEDVVPQLRERGALGSGKGRATLREMLGLGKVTADKALQER